MLSRIISLLLITLALGTSSVQATELAMTGYLAAYYVDHLDHQNHSGKAEMIYKLNLKNGKSIKLKFLKPPRNPGQIDQLSIKGHKDGDQIIVESYQELNQQSKARLINSSQFEASGVQTTLVVGIRDSSRSLSSFIHSPSSLQSIYFSSTEPSLDTYYREVSKNRTSFSGQVTNTLDVSNLCSGGDIFAESGDFKALEAAILEGFDLKDFGRISFVLPDDDHCLPSGIAGIGSLGKVTLTYTDGSTHRISINFVKSSTPIGSGDYFINEVVIHEFGHNLGLAHDNANVCGERIFNEQCPSLEYGGAHSVMGLAPTLAHINAIHKNDLGWLTSTEIQTLGTGPIDQTFTVSPIASSDSNLKAIRIPRGDGSFYVVEYRAAINLDAVPLFPTINPDYGLLIYVNDEDSDNDTVLLASDMIDRTPSLSINSSGNYLDVGLAIDMNALAPFTSSFYDDVHQIRITPITTNSATASFRVETQVTDGAGTSSPPTTPVEEPTDDTSLLDNWSIELDVENPEPFYYYTLKLLKNASYTEHSDYPITKVEWDFDNDGTTELYSYGSLSSTYLFKEAGSHTISATIYFDDGQNLTVTSEPIEINPFFLDLNLRAPKTSTQSENTLAKRRGTRFLLDVTNSENQSIEIINRVWNKKYRELVKIKQPKLKIGSNSTKAFKISVASEQRFKAKRIRTNNGYYEIPLRFKTTDNSGDHYSYPVLRIKSAD